MTVVITDKSVMAADSFIDDKGVRSKDRKIFRVEDALIGIAGDYNAGYRFANWYPNRQTRKRRPKGDFEALVWTKEGLYYWDKEYDPVPISDPVYAIGGGRDAALGAYFAGASIEGSVLIACRVSTSCAEPVQVERL